MDQYDRVIWRGAYMTRRQRQALIATENHIRDEHPRWDFRFTVPQGSWRPQTSYSGTSHTGAGVVDLQYAGFYGDVGFKTRAEKEKAKYVLRKLREVGRQGALMRGEADDMVNHYHVMDLDTHGMSYTSKTFQVPQYKQGYNALDAGVRDRYPYRPKPIRKWVYREAKKK
jgi:hypothetical protein